jgi:hypothetical protein
VARGIGGAAPRGGGRASSRRGLLQTIEAYGLSPARLVIFIDAHSADLYDEPVDPERYGAETSGTIVMLASQILGGQSEDIEHISRHVGAAEAFALGEQPNEMRQHREAAARLLPGTPEQILPALLPATTIGNRNLPPWRRQWLIWRAARDPRRIFS